MRHKKHRFLLNRFSSFRKATVKEIVRSVFIYHKVITTEAKAKAVRPVVEKIISIAKDNTLTARRKVYDIIGNHSLVKKIFDKIVPVFVNKNSGFTRIIFWKKRHGDNAQLVIFELSEQIADNRQEKVKKVKKTAEQPIQEEKLASEKPAAEEKNKFLGGFKSLFKKEKHS